MGHDQIHGGSGFSALGRRVCDWVGIGPASSPLLVSSSANQYVLPAPVEIFATNQTDEPLFLWPCQQHEQQEEGGGWQGIPNLECPTIVALIRLAPGATDSGPAGFVDAPGTYRVGFSYTMDSSLKAAQQQSFSNSFSIRR